MNSLNDPWIGDCAGDLNPAPLGRIEVAGNAWLTEAKEFREAPSIIRELRKRFHLDALDQLG
jgi:hypothetical protein